MDKDPLVLARLTALAAVLSLALAGCSGSSQGEEPDDPGVAAEPIEPPELGACRLLRPEDIAEPANDSPTVDCASRHTAETFAVGTFPSDVAQGADFGDRELGAYVYETCQERFQGFLGGDESTVMRSLLTWAWFRPSEEAWKAGARWYRCDAVSGTADSARLRPLPTTAQGLLSGRPPDAWMTCAAGKTVAGSRKVPCSKPHNWRAVTTIKVGEPDDPYPGDRAVEARTRDYCSDSVGAWMNYPVNYEFGYTFFRKAEWKAGNRRSICWAHTDQ